MTLRLDESLSADIAAQAAVSGLNAEELLAQIVRANLPKTDETVRENRRDAIRKIKELRKGTSIDLKGQSMNKFVHDDHKY